MATAQHRFDAAEAGRRDELAGQDRECGGAQVEMDQAAATLERSPMLRNLDPRVIGLWRLGWLIRTFVFTALAVVALRLTGLPLPPFLTAGAVFATGITLTVLWPPLQYRHWGFQVRESDVFLRHGVLWQTTSVVPHGRIQHVDTQQGPIERSIGLASVVMFTAGTVGASLSIPGLVQEDAESLRERLAQLSGSDDAV